MSSLADDHLARELFIRAAFPLLARGGVERVSDSLEPLSVGAGTVLFEIDEAPRNLYFVVDGEIVMEREGEPSWSFGPRSVVGIIDALLNRPRKRSARAVSASQLFVLRASIWFDLLDEDPLLARGATVALARQVHELWLTLAPSLPGHDRSGAPLAQDALSLYQKILTLRDSRLFRHAGVQAVASLAHFAEEVPLADGEILFPEGAPPPTLDIIVSGAIQVAHTREAWTYVYGPSDLVGGAAALSRDLAAYTARSLGQSLLLRVRDEDYYDQAEEHADLIRAALAYLVSEREMLMGLRPPAA